MAGLLLIGALSARFAILSPQGRLLVEAGANGLKLGRIGKLKVEGVEGDLMKDFRIRRLTIVDERGYGWRPGPCRCPGVTCPC